MDGLTFSVPPSDEPPTAKGFKSSHDLTIRSLTCAIPPGDHAVIADVSLDFEHYVKSFDVAAEFIVEPFAGLVTRELLVFDEDQDGWALAFRGRARVTAPAQETASATLAPSHLVTLELESGRQVVYKEIAFRIAFAEPVRGLVRLDLECFEQSVHGDEECDKWTTMEEFRAALHGYRITDCELRELRKLMA